MMKTSQHPLLYLIVTALLLLSPLSWGQQAAQPPPRPQQPPAGGAATGGVYAPVRDAQKRPITAGGFVDGGPGVFKNVAKQAGLAGWVQRPGTPAETTNLAKGPRG